MREGTLHTPAGKPEEEHASDHYHINDASITRTHSQNGEKESPARLKSIIVSPEQAKEKENLDSQRMQSPKEGEENIQENETLAEF